MSTPTLPRRSLRQRLFEPRDILSSSPFARAAAYSILVAWAVVVLFPLYWVAITSLKLPVHVSDGPFYLPFVDFQPSLDAWRYILVETGRDTLRPYVNSLYIAAISTVVAMLLGAMAAYSLVRVQHRVKTGSIVAFVAIVAAIAVVTTSLQVPLGVALASGLALFGLFLSTVSRHLRREVGNNDLLFWVVSNRILPPVVTVLPIYVMFQRAGLLDTSAALIATYVAVNLPIVVWLMRDFFAGVPIDMEESAAIDGASKMRIFWTIVLPMTRNGLVATTLLVFILCWNEYLLALFLSTANTQTMPLLIAAQNATRGPQWWTMSALIILMIAPVVALTVALQKQIARGLMAGAVKG